MTPTPGTASISDKTVAISITFGALGNQRKVSTSEVEVDADKALIHVSKRLLDSPELKAITHHRAELRSWLMGIALPSLFRSGIYLVPIPAVERVEARMAATQKKDVELVEAFMAVYQACKDQAEIRLKGLFNPKDYSGADTVRASFSFEWAWISFSTPGRLKEISASFFKQEQEKAAVKWQEAGEQIQVLLRSQFKGLVDHMVERLTPDESGKMKRFHATTVSNVAQFIENFSIRNVTDDAELDALIVATKKLLSGVDAESLRDSDQTRVNICQGFGFVKDCLDQMVVEGGTRRISFLDNE